MARRVEDQVRPQAALEEHAGRVDGDALGLLVLEGVEQEGVLERLGVELALRPHLLELPVRKRVGVGQKAADDRALAVIDVTDDHDVHPLGARRSGHARFGRCDGRRHSRVTFLRDRRRAGEPAQVAEVSGARRPRATRAEAAGAFTPPARGYGVSGCSDDGAQDGGVRPSDGAAEQLTAPPRRSRTGSSSRLPWRLGHPDR